MARQENDYFEMMSSQMGYAALASAYLLEILHNYSAEQLQTHRQKMHEIEHAADNQRHDMLARLSKEFITPIDQEDILGLIQIIDDVTDALDEVATDLYMYPISTLPETTYKLAKVVDECVQALQKAIEELRNFKRPDNLQKLLVNVNSMESKADDVYIEAVHDLLRSDMRPQEMLGIKAIYDSLENCCDLCEHAADVVERVLMKNA